MEKNNLMFFVVGKTKNNEVKLLKLNPTQKGWFQSCFNDSSFFNEYVSNEGLTDLLDWFKLDFYQYRIFQDQEEAKEYADEKMNVNNHL